MKRRKEFVYSMSVLAHRSGRRWWRVFGSALRVRLRAALACFVAGANDDTPIVLITIMAGMQNHRKLEIWTRSCALCVSVRAATDGFPRRGYSELKEQTISAAESMAHTIAEGCGADSQKEFARFLSMSIKSATELESELELAKDYRILPEERYRVLADETVLIRRKTFALRKKVLASDRDDDHQERRAPTNRRRPRNSENTKPVTKDPRPTTP